MTAKRTKKPLQTWHIECGDLPACRCGRALEQARTICESHTLATLEAGVARLLAAGWVNAHIVEGQCPAGLEEPAEVPEGALEPPRWEFEEEELDASTLVVEPTTAEGWCSAVVAAYRPRIEALGYTVPRVVISPGFTSGGSRKTQRLGECWSTGVAEDGSSMIFLNPTMSDPIQIAHVVVHELIHAVVGVEHKHDKSFGKLARALGCAGKLTSTTWTPEAAEDCREILRGIGPYPRAAFGGGSLKRPTKKQQTYLLKVECPECGYTMRVTSKWIEIATPTCPCCDVECAVAGRKEG